MDWLKSLTEILKLNFSKWVALTLICGILLFMPEGAAKVIKVDALRQSFAPYLGVGLVCFGTLAFTELAAMLKRLVMTNRTILKIFGFIQRKDGLWEKNGIFYCPTCFEKERKWTQFVVNKNLLICPHCKGEQTNPNYIPLKIQTPAVPWRRTV